MSKQDLDTPMMIDGVQYVKLDKLAKILGIEIYDIQTLSNSGNKVMMYRQIHGEKYYPLMENIKSYIGHLRGKLNKANERIHYKELKEHKSMLTKATAMDKAKLKERELKVQKLMAQLAFIKGNSHSTEDVKRVMTDMLANFKVRLRSIPLKLAHKLVGLDDWQKAADVLSSEIEDTCNVLKDYSAEDFYYGNTDYMQDLQDFEDDEEDEADFDEKIETEQPEEDD